MRLTNLQKNILSIFAILLIAMVFNFVFETVAFSSVPIGLAIAVPFVNLSNTQDCNMAGIATVIYVIKAEDVEDGGYPLPITTPVTPGDIVKASGNFVLKDNKVWTKMYSTQEMGELLSEIDGPRDGKYIKVSGSFFYPKTTAEALGMATLLMRTDVYVIMKEFSAGGQMRIIGTPDLPARVYGSENSGKAFGDEKGITYTLEASNCTYPYIYTGEVKTEATLHGTFTTNNTTGTSGDNVSGFGAVTGWDKVLYPTLWFDIFNDPTDGLRIRAYETEIDRDAGTNDVFYADADVVGVNTIISTNGSGYGGNLEVTGIVVDSDDFDITWTATA